MDFMESPFCYLAVSATVKLLCSAWQSTRIPARAELVGHVTRITLFPAKSMRGLDLDEAECTHLGLKMPFENIYDRCWLLVEGDHENRFITARQEPKLLLVQPSFHQDQLCLDAPGMETIRIHRIPDIKELSRRKTKVWGDAIEGWDCGEEVGRWFSRYLERRPGEQCRLISSSHVDVEETRAIDRKPILYSNVAKPQDRLTYHDDGPYLLIAETSLEDLNTRLTQPITMDTFRPSIVVRGITRPYDEDNWNEVFIGNVKFTAMMLCARCLLTTMDPDKGKPRQDNEPLHTLKSYRNVLESCSSPCFGTYFVCDRPGKINGNDAVYALRKISPE